MSLAPYRIPEAAPDYEADDINDALRAAAERGATCDCNTCSVGVPCLSATHGVCALSLSEQLAAEDAEAARIEAERVPCASCGIYTVAAEGETCVACDEERFGERRDFNDDGHEVTR